MLNSMKCRDCSKHKTCRSSRRGPHTRCFEPVRQTNADRIRAMDDEELAERIRDNPAGQDDELTPFIIIRDIGDNEAEPFVPLVAVEGPTD